MHKAITLMKKLRREQKSKILYTEALIFINLRSDVLYISNIKYSRVENYSNRHLMQVAVQVTNCIPFT